MAARVPPLRSLFRTHGEIRDMVVATYHDGGLTFDESVRVRNQGHSASFGAQFREAPIGEAIQRYVKSGKSHLVD